MTGRLVDLGLFPAGNPVVSGYTEAFWAPARGAIALVRAAPAEFSLDLAQTPTGGYVPGQISALAAIDYAAYAAALTNPIFQGLFGWARWDPSSPGSPDRPRCASLSSAAPGLSAARSPKPRSAAATR